MIGLILVNQNTSNPPIELLELCSMLVLKEGIGSLKELEIHWEEIGIPQ